MTAIIFQLPWPPSANTYWRRNGARYFISLKGQEYRKAVISKCFVYCNYFTKDHKLKISLDCYPPDKRRRDLDNLGKAVLDSLQHASVYPDDSQIVELTFRRMPKYGGYLDITLESVDTCT